MDEARKLGSFISLGLSAGYIQGYREGVQAGRRTMKGQLQYVAVVGFFIGIYAGEVIEAIIRYMIK